jgi:hypothetical protein
MEKLAQEKQTVELAIRSLTERLTARSMKGQTSSRKATALIKDVERVVHQYRTDQTKVFTAVDELDSIKTLLRRLQTYVPHRTMGQEAFQDPLSNTDVETICERFLQLSFDNGVLTKQYVELMDDATRLKGMHSALRTEWKFLKSQDSGFGIIERVKRDGAGAVVGCTYNQLITEDLSEPNSQVTVSQEQAVLQYFTFILGLIQKSLKLIRFISSQTNEESPVNITLLEEDILRICAGKTRLPVRPASKRRTTLPETETPRLLLNTRSLEVSPNTSVSFDVVEGLRTSMGSGQLFLQQFQSQPLLRMFVTEDTMKDFRNRYMEDTSMLIHFPELVQSAHTQCVQQIMSLTRLYADLKAHIEAADARLRSALTKQVALNKITQTQLQRANQDIERRIQKGPFDTEFELDYSSILRKLFGAKYERIRKRKGKAWERVEDPIPSPQSAIKPYSPPPESPTDEKAFEEVSLSLLQHERKMIKQRITNMELSRSKLALRTPPLVTTSLSTSPRAIDTQSPALADMRRYRCHIDQVKRLGTFHLERATSRPAYTSRLQLRRLKSPDWNKNTYFPVLQMSLQGDVLGIMKRNKLIIPD